MLIKLMNPFYFFINRQSYQVPVFLRTIKPPATEELHKRWTTSEGSPVYSELCARKKMYSRYIVTCVRTKYCKPLLTHLLNFGIKGMLSNVLICNVILLQEATLMHNNEYFLLFCLFDSMSESKSRIFFWRYI